MRLLGANPATPFVAWLYRVSGGMVAPFAGAFPSLNFGGFILELSTIFAMIGYAIIAWLVLRLVSFVSDAMSSSRI